MFFIVDKADKTTIIHTGLNWQLREHCNRGYSPWWSIHKKRRLMGFSWWSGPIKSGDHQGLAEFVLRWERWPKYE